MRLSIDTASNSSLNLASRKGSHGNGQKTDAFSEFKSILQQVASAVQNAAGGSTGGALDIPLTPISTGKVKAETPVKEKAAEKDKQKSDRTHPSEEKKTRPEKDSAPVKEKPVQKEQSPEHEVKECEADVEVEVEVDVEVEVEAATEVVVAAEEVEVTLEENIPVIIDSEETELVVPVTATQPDNEVVEEELVSQAGAELQILSAEEKPAPLEELMEEAAVLDTANEQPLPEAPLQEEVTVKTDGKIDIQEFTLLEEAGAELVAEQGNPEAQADISNDLLQQELQKKLTLEQLEVNAADVNTGTDTSADQGQSRTQGQQLSAQIRALLQQVQQNNGNGQSAAPATTPGADVNANTVQTIVTGQPNEKAAEAHAKAKEARPLPQSFQQKTIAKIEEVLKEVSGSKDGKTLSVRLDPPELGSVKIDISFRDGNLQARLVAENPQVMQLLKERGLELQQMLRRLGLNVDQIHVAVGGDHESAGKDYLPERDTGRRGSGHPGFAGSDQESIHPEGRGVQNNTIDYWVA